MNRRLEVFHGMFHGRASVSKMFHGVFHGRAGADHRPGATGVTVSESARNNSARRGRAVRAHILTIGIIPYASGPVNKNAARDPEGPAPGAKAAFGIRASLGSRGDRV